MAPKLVLPPGIETPPGLKKITDMQRQTLQELFTTLVDRRPENCEAIGLQQVEHGERSPAYLTECVSPNPGKEEVFEKVVLDERLKQVQIYLNGKYYVHETYDLEVGLPEVFQDATLQPNSDVGWLDGKIYEGHIEAYDFSQRRVTVIFYSKWVGKGGLSPQLERIRILRWS